MSTDPHAAPRPLPDRPNLRHLKDQAKDLLKAGEAESIADAQFKIARLYGFASWPKLKAHVESLEEIGQLKEAIDANDVERVKALMMRNPKLHATPMDRRGRKPLTWVAECRNPRQAPSPERLGVAKWMIDNGSDVHQDNDYPLARAVLADDRIPMMELLVAHGADVNARTSDGMTMLMYACDTLSAGSLQWLLDHGADPNAVSSDSRHSTTALDYLIGAYHRSPHLAECMETLLSAGGRTRYDSPAVLALLRDRLDALAELIDAEPSLLSRHFPELDCGHTGGRLLTLAGGTLLHVAAEYGNVAAAALLLDRGADINARATVNDAGVGGQTAIFHAATQFDDGGLAVTQLLIDRGADLSIRAKLPGHYERPGELVECTPLGYALLFGSPNERRTVNLLRERRAIES